jgi:hypothetical protein
VPTAMPTRQCVVFHTSSSMKDSFDLVCVTTLTRTEGFRARRSLTASPNTNVLSDVRFVGTLLNVLRIVLVPSNSFLDSEWERIHNVRRQQLVYFE